MQQKRPNFGGRFGQNCLGQVRDLLTVVYVAPCTLEKIPGRQSLPESLLNFS